LHWGRGDELLPEGEGAVGEEGVAARGRVGGCLGGV